MGKVSKNSPERGYLLAVISTRHIPLQVSVQELTCNHPSSQTNNLPDTWLRSTIYNFHFIISNMLSDHKKTLERGLSHVSEWALFYVSTLTERF